MKKEILIYRAIYDYTVADIMTQLEGAKDSDINCRVNSPGGEVYYAYGLIAKYQEHPKGKFMQVDGIAASAAAFMCCCSDQVECLDVSSFLFHRAAFPLWIESSPEYFTDSRKAELAKINKNLRAFMESKFTAQAWQDVTGVSLDDLFSLDSRIDVTIDARQARKLGLVNKINSITPQKKAEIESMIIGVAAMQIPDVPVAATNVPDTTITQNQNRKMTLQELKAQHPDVFKAAYDEGVAAEKDRAEAYLEFADVDLKAVKEGIAGGKEMSRKLTAELARKSMQQGTIAAMHEENPADINTPEAEKQKQNLPNAKAHADFERDWTARTASLKES